VRHPPDTISEEAIAQEEKVVAQAAEAEVEEVEVTAPVLQF
jgi:hypothetical protein